MAMRRAQPVSICGQVRDRGKVFFDRRKKMKTLGCAIWVALGASLALRALAQPTPAQAHLREIYRELVEINTTDSAGSCTAAAEAMAARLKAAGLPAQEGQVIVPPGGPNKGNLVTRYPRTGAKKPV